MAFTHPTDDAHDLVSVEVPRAGSIVSALVGSFWLLCGLSYTPLLRGLGHSNRAEAEDVTFGIFLMLGGVVTLWLAFARRCIIVSAKELRYETTALGLSTTRRFALDEIKNLRVDEKRVFSYYPWLAFDRNGKRKFIGRQLPEILSPNLLDPIYERFPQLAPGK